MDDAAQPEAKPLPEPTVARLPVYQRIATELERAGTATTSSDELARLSGGSSAQVRKDLSLLGSLGQRGTGYDTRRLIEQIDVALGADRDWPVVIAGVGNLGRALVNARGFLGRGYRLVGLVDADPELVGTELGGLEVQSFAGLAATLESPPAIGIVATPARFAQDAADELLALGVRSLLNFAPRRLEAPPEVVVRYVDLSIELQVLSYQAATSGRPAPISSTGMGSAGRTWGAGDGQGPARS